MAWSIAHLLSPLPSSILLCWLHAYQLLHRFSSLMSEQRHFEIPAFLPAVFAITDHYFLLFFMTSHYPDFLPTSWKASFTYFLNSSSSAAAAKLLQSCPTPCDPIDGSPPGFSVPPHLNSPLNIGVPQNSILEFCSSVSALSLGNHIYPLFSIAVYMLMTQISTFYLILTPEFEYSLC